MTAPEISNIHEVYQGLKPALELLRAVIVGGYALIALADFYCVLSGRYCRAGVKPLPVVYLESRPWASAIAWLCLHTFMVSSMLNGYSFWWRPALFMIGFGVFLAWRVWKALSSQGEANARGGMTEQK